MDGMRFLWIGMLVLGFGVEGSHAQETTPAQEPSVESEEEHAHPFWQTREEIVSSRHVITPRFGFFYNRIDGDQASTQSEGTFLSSPSYRLGVDWEFAQDDGWATFMSAGLMWYRYDQDIDTSLFQEDQTLTMFEYWLGMQKTLLPHQPLTLRLQLGSYQDVYYFAPTFNTLTFANDTLIAMRLTGEWLFKSWHKKDLGASLYFQGMRRGEFLRGGNEVGLQVLFSAYPLRFVYEFSISHMRTTSLDYRMLESALMIEYLFSL